MAALATRFGYKAPIVIATVVVSDRGDRYLPGCISSLECWLPLDNMSPRYIVDDREHRLGMAGAVQDGFRFVLDVGADYVFWVEEDFRFHEPIPLARMQQILEDNPHLAQVVLKRQPWSPQERVAGGIIEANPGAYKQCDGFVEHQQIFSLNPSLIPRRVVELGWPSGGLDIGNESGFTDRCLDAGYLFAFYGQMWDPPRCEHVGYERGAGWKL